MIFSHSRRSQVLEFCVMACLVSPFIAGASDGDASSGPPVGLCLLCAQTSSSLCAFPRHSSTRPCYGRGGASFAHRAIGRCCPCPIVVRPGIVPVGLAGSCLGSVRCPAIRLQGTCHSPYPVRAIRRTQYVPFAVLNCAIIQRWPLWPFRGGPSRKRGWPRLVLWPQWRFCPFAPQRLPVDTAGKALHEHVEIPPP